MKIWMTALGWPVVISVPSYAIMGAAASLGGATRMTLSITVLVMETTGALQLITPIMITVFFAKIVGDNFGYGIYDTHIRLRGTPLLDEFQLEIHQRMLTDKLQVGEISDPVVVAVLPVAPVRMVVDILRGCSHGTIAVTPDVKYKEGKPSIAHKEFELQGVLQRGQLLKVIKHRLAFFHMNELGIYPPEKEFIPKSNEKLQEMLSKLEQVPMRTHLAEEGAILDKLSDEDLDTYFVDLRPFMKRHPYVMREDAPVSRAYRLFRTMGLRQLFVTTAPKCKSVVTRKDLVDDNLMLVLGQKAHAGSIEITEKQKRRFVRQQSTLVPILRFDHYYSKDEHEAAHQEREYERNLSHQFNLVSSRTESPIQEETPVPSSFDSVQEQKDSDSPSTPLLPK
eukprot:TRINITY_DN2065_c0_g1_i3.p1 TRINITY_DN2065_c0_g1~~TRINITY_DN2065_c0_g1_i3.p1  ORF type:complete len:395 (+),score=57.32 TRINITY_DN2065_c0_g1_i3:130-1314(+)